MVCGFDVPLRTHWEGVEVLLIATLGIFRQIAHGTGSRADARLNPPNSSQVKFFEFYMEAPKTTRIARKNAGSKTRTQSHRNT